jgi:DNA-binding transcriptional regulator YbjK
VSSRMSSEDQIRKLVKRALAVTDEPELHRTMEELRSALRKHIEHTRKIGLASYPDRRPKSINGGGTR